MDTPLRPPLLLPESLSLSAHTKVIPDTSKRKSGILDCTHLSVKHNKDTSRNSLQYLVYDLIISTVLFNELRLLKIIDGWAADLISGAGGSECYLSFLVFSI